jgi:hypothetical protein
VELNIGDSVVVKSGVLDPDFEIDIGGWQGRIEEIDDKTAFIRWDSITLQKMPFGIIIRCENENLDWALMTLNIDEISITTARDSESDVSHTADQIRLKIIDDPSINAEPIA